MEPVTIDDLIKLLEVLRVTAEKHGETPVVWESMHRIWPPDPVLRERSGRQVVVLNS